ncbi:hypothetical protein PJM26_18305, partial [Mycobacterium kansasii]
TRTTRPLVSERSGFFALSVFALVSVPPPGRLALRANGAHAGCWRCAPNMLLCNVLMIHISESRFISALFN